MSQPYDVPLPWDELDDNPFDLSKWLGVHDYVWEGDDE